MGNAPYIAIVGNDCIPGHEDPILGTCPLNSAANPYYFSTLEQQFMYDTGGSVMNIPDPMNGYAPFSSDIDLNYVREGNGYGSENFLATNPADQPDPCAGSQGKPCSVVRAGNAGFFEWWIRFPFKPQSTIVIEIQCGVIPAGSAVAPNPGVNPLNIAGLATIEAAVYMGMNNFFSPGFHLTAFKNPSAYTLAFDPDTYAMSNNVNGQLLDGSINTRFVITPCIPQHITVKLPVSGQLNAMPDPPGIEVENDLEYGDIIKIRINILAENTVDIYAHAQSVRLRGMGETQW